MSDTGDSAPGVVTGGRARHVPPIIRFGPFELDLRSGALRKNGSRVGLQDQPLQILSVLLERPGEMVTREELRQRLWAADTFVDTALDLLERAYEERQHMVASLNSNPLWDGLRAEPRFQALVRRIGLEPDATIR